MILLKIKSKVLLLLLVGFLPLKPLFAQQSYLAKDFKISLYSSTPLEDIKALSENGYSVLVPKNKQIVFQVAIKSFVFARELMQEHFNESYMESDKFLYATFKGNIMQDLDFSKDGSYEVSVKGILTVHGVAKERVIKGKIDILNKKISLFSSFNVACIDHDIKIPSVVFKKIAENITITVKGNYQ